MKLRSAQPNLPPPRPLRLLLLIAGAVFAAEAAVMLLLLQLPLSAGTEILLDAALLTLLLFPTLYLFLYQRLAKQLRRHLDYEEELAELRDFFKNTLDNIASGVYVTDHLDTIRYANRTIEKISDLPLNCLEGASVLTDFPEETLCHFRPHYLKAKTSLAPLAYDALPVTTPTG
ncbi:MAG TPA: hypothetical protein VLL73_04240, partial [Desulfurivibrionaceae bacterium]|nr:hypothetical protein [Desulfurivibrionaceae bacterium]